MGSKATQPIPWKNASGQAWACRPVTEKLVSGAPAFRNVHLDPHVLKLASVFSILTRLQKAEREGMYYGQCSELCGKDHAFMPIAVRVVNDAEYTTWVDQAKKKYATDERASPKALAAADTVK